MSPRIWAVVPAAGSGRRMGTVIPKQYLQLQGRSVLEHSLNCVLRHPWVMGAVVALNPEDELWPGWAELAGKRLVRVDGGSERADSVRSALAWLARHEPAANVWALVHDAARPCLRDADLDRLIKTCLSEGQGGLLAAPVRDTLKRVGPGGTEAPLHSLGTEPREGLWRALTPQLFPLSDLLAALDAARTAETLITDEAMAMERCGYRPLLVQGADDNLKITTPSDLALAEFLLQRGVSPD